MGVSCVVCSCCEPNEKPNFFSAICKNKKRRVRTSFVLNYFLIFRRFYDFTDGTVSGAEAGDVYGRNLQILFADLFADIFLGEFDPARETIA